MCGSFLTSGLPPTPGASGASPGPWATPQACRRMVHPGKPRPEGLSSWLLSHGNRSSHVTPGESNHASGDKGGPGRSPPGASPAPGCRCPFSLTCQWVGRKE